MSRKIGRKRKLLVFLGVLCVIIAMVFGLRAYNIHTYGSMSSDDAASLADPATYNTTVEGVTVSRYDRTYVRGFHLVPAHRTKAGSVIVFGGSEGSSAFEDAAELARSGVEVYSLFFFGQDGQQSALREVPLEFIEEVLPEAPHPITVRGASKGAELALNLAARYPEIDNVIAVAPSAYSFNGLDYTSSSDRSPHSSWRWRGEPVPYVPFAADATVMMRTIGGSLLGFPTSSRAMYDASLNKASESDRETARIKVENFKGNILLLAGEDDRMWDSAGAASIIADHASRRPDGSGTVESFTYPGAGHALGGPRYIAGLDLGGNEDANKHAHQDSDKVIMRHIADWHEAQSVAQ